MKPTDTSTGERLQKVLANAGLGSRREIEGWISAGRVTVNNQVARLGQRVKPEDRIQVDGKPVAKRRLAMPQRLVLLYNKPEGELVTRKDPAGRATVFERLPKLEHGRWIPVGRLDINSSGLLLLTTDGELANRLMHPSQQVEREYAVRVMGEVSEDQLKQLTHGVELEDGPARFEEIVEAGGSGINRWYHVVIMEGRRREVRRMWEAVGATVSRLKRVRYASVFLDSAVKVGQWRYLTDGEIDKLLQSMGLSAEKPSKNSLPAKSQRSRRSATKPVRPTTTDKGSDKLKRPKATGNPWARKRPDRRKR
jgi:23S rRNA pseudouridine2605 synthase